MCECVSVSVFFCLCVGLHCLETDVREGDGGSVWMLYISCICECVSVYKLGGGGGDGMEFTLWQQ